MDPAFPDLDAEFESWRVTDESVETLFELPGARVRGATRRYEDVATRAAVREATDGALDREWRFVAATGLGFQPPLPPGSTPIILPMVHSESRDAFADRLAERGLEQIERRGDQRLRVGSGGRARLAQYRAIDPGVDGGLPVAGCVAVWHDAGDLFVVTGGYPDGRLADLLSLDDPPELLDWTPSEYRDEFVDILRSVR